MVLLPFLPPEGAARGTDRTREPPSDAVSHRTAHAGHRLRAGEMSAHRRSVDGSPRVHSQLGSATPQENRSPGLSSPGPGRIATADGSRGLQPAAPATWILVVRV